MARISRIVVTQHQLPLDPPFPASWDPRPRTRFPATLVRVFDEDGRMGVGSGDAMLGFSDFEHLFIGHEALDLDRHHAILMNMEFHAGRPWPLDVALWDLAGKTQGQAIWKMLGGKAPRLRAYQSSGVHRSTHEMVGVAMRCLAAGFPALKVRFGRPDLADDLAVLHAIREAVGDHVLTQRFLHRLGC
jgi:L-alanine-DL-glutamate epimerase-like enolase superfamily enzyme